MKIFDFADFLVMDLWNLIVKIWAIGTQYYGETKHMKFILIDEKNGV